MALWSKKKVGSKITSYLKEKNISFQIEESNTTNIKFELCFTESGFILYPYITVDESKNIISFNVNVSQINVKNNGFSILNEINKMSMFLKAYITDESILVLEYRFKVSDDVSETLNCIMNDLFSLENTIDKL